MNDARILKGSKKPPKANQPEGVFDSQSFLKMEYNQSGKFFATN